MPPPTPNNAPPPMQSFETNDGVRLRYIDTGCEDAAGREKPWLVLIHGFTGSSLVWQRNIPSFTPYYRVIAPDLRGHGESDKPEHGFQVSRLAMDLRELVCHLQSTEEKGKERQWKAIGGSLGCSILWCYASLFTTSPFTHTIFVDQSPLQNRLPDWGPEYCNRGMNSPSSLLSLQTTLATSPATAHLGTISACLSYLAYPLPGDEEKVSQETREQDERFFLGEAMKGNQTWLGRLMGDHTAQDWRASIAATFGPKSGSGTRVLVVASERSGCFPAEGPLFVVSLVRGDDEEAGKERAKGVSVSWGGHWCYWEDPDKFNKLCLDFLSDCEMDEEMGRWV
ncbi:Alpha/Beta hydrolase protein [Rhexocercosporidium sp. MPI-PUGE-AT-0058]|nr:Alpha/Beta hydrolase protein [Rhexocercosporidium sp. MPI-PUGE-AT-0058]